MNGNWDAYPMSKAVNWPQDEKIIGVLGVAPLATADFFQKLCAIRVEKDWQHPRVIIDSNPKIPSRGRHLELGETDPVPYIREGIMNLVGQGAQIIALPCNTAHILRDKYARGFDVPIPDMIAITADACALAGMRKPMVLASRLVIENGLYQRALKQRGMEAIIPDSAGQRVVGECIEAVKQHGYDADLARELHAIATASTADGIILGCTELPILFAGNKQRADVPIIDSARCLARHCLEFAGIGASVG